MLTGNAPPPPTPPPPPSGAAPPAGAKVYTYFLLFHFTPEGARAIKASPERVGRANSIVRSLGGQCDFYLTVGAYDMVSICRFTDDRAIAKLVLALNALGSVRVTVLTAWNLYSEDYKELIGSLPS